MRAVIQRVLRASVTIDGELRSSIDRGFLVLLGVGTGDTAENADYLADKCSALRVFEDENGKMNLSAAAVGGDFLVVSNFTLYGDCKRGNRPGFTDAALPAVAEPLYMRFAERLRSKGFRAPTGEFGADMKIDLINDGPVTLIMDTAVMR